MSREHIKYAVCKMYIIRILGIGPVIWSEISCFILLEYILVDGISLRRNYFLHIFPICQLLYSPDYSCSIQGCYDKTTRGILISLSVSNSALPVALYQGGFILYVVYQRHILERRVIFHTGISLAEHRVKLNKHEINTIFAE